MADYKFAENQQVRFDGHVWVVEDRYEQATGLFGRKIQNIYGLIRLENGVWFRQAVAEKDLKPA